MGGPRSGLEEGATGRGNLGRRVWIDCCRLNSVHDTRFYRHRARCARQIAGQLLVRVPGWEGAISLLCLCRLSPVSRLEVVLLEAYTQQDSILDHASR